MLLSLPLFSRPGRRTRPLWAAFASSLLILGISPMAHAATPQADCPPLLQHTFPRLQDEKPQNLCQYRGRVLLVVNTASYCGYTGQYEGLEALHRRYQERGLVVLGFPSNDFRQEKASNAEIAEFCENTFGIRFPMFAASSVRGPQASAFYRQLAAEAGQAPSWNFHKYLIDRAGQVVGAFPAATPPEGRVLVREVERLLAQPVPPMSVSRAAPR